MGLNSIALRVLDTDVVLTRKKRPKGKLASGATAAVSAGQSSPAAVVVSAVVAQTVGSPAAPVVAGSGSAGAGTPVAVPGRVIVRYCRLMLLPQCLRDNLLPRRW